MLLVLNGAPAVGKSMLARRYADEHALALVVDIDLIRTHLGRWAEVDESKLVARDVPVISVGDGPDASYELLRQTVAERS